jgi:ornithine cyclodeaminase
MGSDFPEKHELEAEALARADVVVADHPPVAARNGELHHALDAGVLRIDDVVPLGALVTGDADGRTSGAQITICDLVGIGVQDAAIAGEVVARARIVL